MEDGLKRLDKLTQEEARMASAQNLKISHTVDDRVKMVDILVQIMVEVLSILGIATKEIKQGRLSEYLLYSII